MARQNTFRKNAVTVQNNESATVTFKRLTRGQITQRFNEQEKNQALPESERKEIPDFLLVIVHDWHGIEGDNGQMLPSPKDDPAVITALYPQEADAIQALFWDGPDTSVKN